MPTSVVPGCHRRFTGAKKLVHPDEADIDQAAQYAAMSTDSHAFDFPARLTHSYCCMPIGSTFVYGWITRYLTGQRYRKRDANIKSNRRRSEVLRKLMVVASTPDMCIDGFHLECLLSQDGSPIPG